MATSLPENNATIPAQAGIHYPTLCGFRIPVLRELDSDGTGTSETACQHHAAEESWEIRLQT
ncbi:MAG: hypothetical protein HYX81_00155 [Chloroflexi bacterium]|nr:hypothetical protein [Chloroflexota bacterium]